MTTVHVHPQNEETMTTSLEPLSWVRDDPLDQHGERTWAEPSKRLHARPGPRPVLEVPAVIVCVPAEQVVVDLNAAQAAIRELRGRLAAVEAELSVVESRLEAEGVEPGASALMARGVAEFLRRLREEAEGEALATVSAARVEARLLRRPQHRREALFEARARQWQRLLVGAAHRPAPSTDAIAWRRPSELSQDGAVEAAADVSVPTVELTRSGDREEREEWVEALSNDPPAVNGEQGRDFWADVDDSDARRAKVRRRLTRTGLLRAGAAACVAAAVLLRLV